MIGNRTKLVADNQLILDAPLLKVPLELIRRNFKSAQRNIDKETKAITASLNEALAKAQRPSASPEDTIASIDIMINRMNTLKRKVCPPLTVAHLFSLPISRPRRSSGFTGPRYV
jgi:macrophage erythroblast attacher